ncbi:nuclear transport factor 2 family protein [Actinomadura barringtoniae]|uniref:Nuclear transport factor 2 family protein n=1 Tax=Actinomadura barringtoniae TaxID=1427535 RepID=A0A939T5S8_9ACTN|nr:nuclear transport factor 2 family protein [Actinomadura barringtoniae]MBO2454101.1 nuclear transport factor 2 family protein [Actinomadura barringtoniae]
MTFTADDRIAITDLIALHGHLCDDGDLEGLRELFTPDVVYDVSSFGGEPIHGIDALIQAGIDLGEGNPVGHHVTNIVLTGIADDRVTARSKGIGISADGGCASLTYDDTIVRTPGGWRISCRVAVVRRTPLNEKFDRSGSFTK